jgi:hypothetical protein
MRVLLGVGLPATWVLISGLPCLSGPEQTAKQCHPATRIVRGSPIAHHLRKLRLRFSCPFATNQNSYQAMTHESGLDCLGTIEQRGNYFLQEDR